MNVKVNGPSLTGEGDQFPTHTAHICDSFQEPSRAIRESRHLSPASPATNFRLTSTF